MSISYPTNARVYNTVNEMSLAVVNNGDTAITKAYSVAGYGANSYKFVAGDTSTIDGGFIMSGIGGRWHALDKSIAHWDQWGCIPDDSTDNSARAQAALNSGKSNHIGTGTYRINSTISMGLSNIAIGNPTTAVDIYGDGLYTSIISAGMTDGSSALKLRFLSNFALRNFAVMSKAWTAGPWLNTASNFVGIHLVDSQRWHFDSINVINAMSGIVWGFENAGSFEGTLSNVNVRYCATGFHAYSWSGTKGLIYVENTLPGGQPYYINYAIASDITIVDQSNQARTNPSDIGECQGSTFQFYVEDGASPTPTVPSMKIGYNGPMYNCKFIGMMSTTLQDNFIKFDKVRGCEANIKFYSNSNLWRNPIGITDTCMNFDIKCGTLHDSYPYIRTLPMPTVIGFNPPVNFIPDPYGVYGIPGTLGRGITYNNASGTSDTVVKPHFAARSLKLTTPSGSTNSWATVRYHFNDFPHLAELKGKTVGVGAWVNIPTNHPVHYSYATSSGIGPHVDFWEGIGTHSNQYWDFNINSIKVKDGNWYWMHYEWLVNAAATYIDYTMFVLPSGASYVANADTSAYFVGPVIWVGGEANADGVGIGQFSHHPQALNPFHRVGSASPSGSAFAPIGTVWTNTGGGPNSAIFIKEALNVNPSGWSPK